MLPVTTQNNTNDRQMFIKIITNESKAGCCTKDSTTLVKHRPLRRVLGSGNKMVSLIP